ncbi:unnamed protein product [Allacma fusca]|uniref:Major facilitator superfamily (MFS) profile domain-containing protein n=1 Tax=Allacma fusca TaxID=39272 RepID=A0A8J2JTV6_9HEXA|nr:unnamed protein product [Allacma fusca]
MCKEGNKKVVEKPGNVEEILESLGGFGKFQFLILFLLLCMEIPCAFLIFVPVFIGVSPPEWLCDNETILTADVCSCPGIVSPIDPDATIVTEWGLICGSSWVSDTIVSLQMSGMLIGNIYISQLSDWYGRRYCFLGITLQMALGSILTAASPNPYVYAFARFLCGSSFSGFLSLNAIYSMEFLTPNWRPVASAVSPVGVAIMILGLLGYLIRPWRSLVYATCIPFIGIIFIFPFITESPRWLLRNNKIDEAYKVFARMAKTNGKEPVDFETLRKIAEKERPFSDKAPEDVVVQRFSYLEFYRNPSLRKTTLCLQGIWFTWGLVYFGIGFNIKNLAGSPYLNMVYMGLMDSLAYPTSFFVNNKIGRRKSMVAFMTLVAFFLVGIAIVQLTLDRAESGVIIAALCFLAKYGTAGARSAARTLTGESYPTAIRVMGIGFSGGTASLGGALAPQLAYLGTYWPSVPFFGFAIISVGGSLVSFLLAETNGRPLEEEVKEDKIKIKLGQDIVHVMSPSLSSVITVEDSEGSKSI